MYFVNLLLKNSIISSNYAILEWGHLNYLQYCLDHKKTSVTFWMDKVW